MKLLPYIIIPILVPLVIKVLFSASSKVLEKANAILLAILLLSTLAPFYPFAGNSHNLYSILDFILKTGNYAFGLMMLAYLLALSLLFLSKNKFSLIVFLGGYIAAWFGLLAKGTTFFTVYDYVKYGSEANLWGVLFPLFYIMFPVLALTLYMPLISSDKSKKEYFEKYEKRQKEIKKLGFKAQLLPLTYTAIPLIIYAVGATYLYDKLLCQGVIGCKVWGSYFSRSALFWVSGFFLFVTIAIAVGRGVLSGEAKIARYFIPLVLALFALGNYVAFQTYVKTDNQVIESKDFINGFGDIKPTKLAWEQIQNFGFDTYKSSGECKINDVYLILKDVA